MHKTTTGERCMAVIGFVLLKVLPWTCFTYTNECIVMKFFVFDFVWRSSYTFFCWTNIFWLIYCWNTFTWRLPRFVQKISLKVFFKLAICDSHYVWINHKCLHVCPFYRQINTYKAHDMWLCQIMFFILCYVLFECRNSETSDKPIDVDRINASVMFEFPIQAHCFWISTHFFTTFR